MTTRVKRPVKVLNEAIPSAVIAAMHATDRVMPMLAGASCIRQADAGGVLVVRTPNADIEVAASNALLELVFRLCDGTQTVDECLAAVDDAAARDEFSSFLGFLFEEGAVIDAVHACAEAVKYGFQYSQFGLVAPAAISDLIAPRFGWNPEGAPTAQPPSTVRVPAAPLSMLFEQRTSVYTFNDKPISEKALLQLLWSAAGIVHDMHPRSGSLIPHRTLGSAGGMHLLKIYVALRRQVGRYAPAVYRVEYPGEQRIALTQVNDDVEALPLAIVEPWKLSYATGMIFVAADPAVGAVRYRNRAFQYLFMEAGAVLHNVALTAPQLRVAQAPIGGYYEQASADLCKLADGELVLGTAIFGAQPTARQIQRTWDTPNFEFAWAGTHAPQFKMGFHLAQARITDGYVEREYAWGRDPDPMLAMRKAMAEAVEREGYSQPRGVKTALLQDLPDGVDPRRHTLYSAQQYEAAGFPFSPFDAARPYGWVNAVHLGSNRPAQVLAEWVFASSSLRAAGAATGYPVTAVTSSGCAAGLDQEDAFQRALYELLERDAFMRHWFAQRPGQVLDRVCWPRSVEARVKHLETAGCKVLIQALDSPWVPVSMVSLQNEAGHFTTVGAGAHTDFLKATNSALDECESRVYAWLNGHTPTVTVPEAARTPEDHLSLYGLPEYFRHADRVLFPSEAPLLPSWPKRRSPPTLRALARRMAMSGLDVYGVDITPDKHHLDQGRTPLYVARVVVPGLVPLAFGQDLQPVAAVPFTHPAARFPHPFP